MKKLVSVICSLALCFSIVAPAAAIEAPSEQLQIDVSNSCISLKNVGAYESLSDTELRSIVSQFNLPESEIDELFAAKNSIENSSSPMRVKFPSNPDIGDTYTDTIHISIEAVQSSAEAFQALVNAGVSIPVATVVAAGLFAYVNANADSGSTGVDVTIEYYYGPDNDGEVRWNYRRVWFSIV